MAALDAEHYLQEIGAQEGKSDWTMKLFKWNNFELLSAPLKFINYKHVSESGFFFF